MSVTIKAIRGMNDVVPDDSVYWQKLEAACREVARQYAYHEIRCPIVEKTDLFKRSVGEVTDIVEKEMYTFDDRNGDSLSLRPEGTVGCVRAGIEQGLLYNQLQRLWYMGPMFRHERPQKGRYRQFHQFGVEAFGMPGPHIDVEQIAMVNAIWQVLGLSDMIRLEINSLGSSACRVAYANELVTYFNDYRDQLDEDSLSRLTRNPLRILDSKNPEMQSLIQAAPRLLDHINEESSLHFSQLCELLDALGIAYTVNTSLVRGLDYYSRTVHEWVTDQLGAQGTVCAGGHYDGLVEQLGGKTTPAVGFALGLERVVLLMRSVSELSAHSDVFIIASNDQAARMALQCAEQLRKAFPGKVIETNCLLSSMKSQFKRADRSGATWAVVIGDEEVNQQQVILKSLRIDMPQETLSVDALIQYLQKEF